MSYVSGGTLGGVIRLSQPAAAPGLSSANEGRIYFDETDGKFKVSEDGGAYVDLAPDEADTLAETLAAGNETGGNNIVVTNGDMIFGEDATDPDGNGGRVDITGGEALGVGEGGGVGLYGGNAVDGVSGLVDIDAGLVTGEAEAGGVYVGTERASEVQINATLFTNDGNEQRVAALNQALWLTAETHDENADGKTVFLWAGDANGDGSGGDISIEAGSPGDVGDAGDVNIITRGANDGAGGNFLFSAGSGGGEGRPGGGFDFFTGAGTGGEEGSSGGFYFETASMDEATDGSTGGFAVIVGKSGDGGRSGDFTVNVGLEGVGGTGGVFFETGWNDSVDGDPEEDGVISLYAGGNIELATNSKNIRATLNGGRFLVGDSGTEATYMIQIDDGGRMDFTAGNNHTITMAAPGSTGEISIDARTINIATDGQNVNIGSPSGGQVAIHYGGGVGTELYVNSMSVNIHPDGGAGTSFVVNSETVSIPNFASQSARIGSSTASSRGYIAIVPSYSLFGGGNNVGFNFGGLATGGSVITYNPRVTPGILVGQNSLHLDGDNNVIRAGDGGDPDTVYPFVVEDPVFNTYNLSDAGAIAASPLEPGSVTIRIVLESNEDEFVEVTDNGSGTFAAGSALPEGGTVNYATAELTGITAAMAANSRVEVVFKLANSAGEQLTIRGGDGHGTGSGGDLTILTGGGGSTSGDSGDMTLDVGEVAGESQAGEILIGTINAESLTIGRSGASTTLDGVTDMTGAVGLGAVATVSANTTLDETHGTVLVDASGGAVTIELPPAASVTRRRYVIKKVDASANAVTVDADDAETIDGATTQPLAAQYDAIEIVSDGTEWFIVSVVSA